MDARLLANIAIYVGGGGLVGAVESLIAPPPVPDSPVAPPAPAIPVAWSALFALLGVARSRVPRAERRWIDRLWLLCVTYPLYTFGQRSRTASLLGNAAVGAGAAAVAARVQRTDPVAAALIAPILPWVGYATLILLTERRES